MSSIRPARISLGWLGPPADADPRQIHRLQRFFLACRTSLIVVFLFFLYHWAGLLEFDALRNLLVAMAAAILVFYTLLRSGLNVRFSDPSLTVWMILAFSAVMLYAIGAARGERSLLVLVYLIPYMFGLFRLSTPAMLATAWLFLAGYGWILAHDTHDAARAPALQLLHWAVPAVVLTWFALFTSYVAELRKRVAQSNRQLSAALEQLRSIISHDDLTGVYNRRRMNELLDLEKTRCDRGGETFCVFILDIDRFKEINDSFGHAAGDAVLKGFAESMKQILRPSDFFGRIGGEEFLIVSTQTSLERAAVLAERMRSHCEATRFPSLPEGWPFTVSVGVTQFRAGEDANASLLRADAALYAAKQGGRNRVEANL